MQGQYIHWVNLGGCLGHRLRWDAKFLSLPSKAMTEWKFLSVFTTASNHLPLGCSCDDQRSSNGKKEKYQFPPHFHHYCLQCLLRAAQQKAAVTVRKEWDTDCIVCLECQLLAASLGPSVVACSKLGTQFLCSGGRPMHIFRCPSSSNG